MRPVALSLIAAISAGTFVFLSAQATQPKPDPAAALSERLESGQVQLTYDEKWGYLRSLLKSLDINEDSQVLVFSRTSLQQDKIGPKTPRAIYFNDTVAVGTVQRGELFEIVAADPVKGANFYTLKTARTEKPAIAEDDGLCLACHANRWVAHAFVATVFPGADGAPFFTGGGGDLFNVTDHRTPFEERWGGWYVSGTHGKMTHMGNAVSHNPYRPLDLETHAVQNQTSLVHKFDVRKYLKPASDMIALMTLEHQTRAVYYMAALSAQFRAADNGKGPNAVALDKAVENLVSYLTFADEAKLESPIKGVSTFTQTFPQRGPRDAKGRSLRDFNLQTRLFEYPLSYMIYTNIYDQMHPKALERVNRRLFEELSKPERRAALEILRETKPNLPDYFRQQ